MTQFEDHSDDEEMRRDECGMPWLPAQRALGYAEESEDATGNVVKEILILPNIIVFFKRVRTSDGLGFVRAGDSILADPSAARELIQDAMPARCEYVTGCDCEQHEGRTLEMLDPEEALR